jgi:hypothetical protein
LPETYAARLRRVNRRRALAVHLVPEQWTRTFRLRLGAMPGSLTVAAFSCALAEQLPKQLHGRFPLTETDPPVGQDEP